MKPIGRPRTGGGIASKASQATMSETKQDLERTWECDWDGHELAQLRRWAQLPFWEKLEWLEEAQRLADHMQGARQKTGMGGQAPDATDSASPDQEGPRKL